MPQDHFSFHNQTDLIGPASRDMDRCVLLPSWAGLLYHRLNGLEVSYEATLRILSYQGYWACIWVHKNASSSRSLGPRTFPWPWLKGARAELHGCFCIPTWTKISGTYFYCTEWGVSPIRTLKREDYSQTSAERSWIQVIGHFRIHSQDHSQWACCPRNGWAWHFPGPLVDSEGDRTKAMQSYSHVHKEMGLCLDL